MTDCYDVSVRRETRGIWYGNPVVLMSVVSNEKHPVAKYYNIEFGLQAGFKDGKESYLSTKAQELMRDIEEDISRNIGQTLEDWLTINR